MNDRKCVSCRKEFNSSTKTEIVIEIYSGIEKAHPCPFCGRLNLGDGNGAFFDSQKSIEAFLLNGKVVGYPNNL